MRCHPEPPRRTYQLCHIDAPHGWGSRHWVRWWRVRHCRKASKRGQRFPGGVASEQTGGSDPGDLWRTDGGRSLAPASSRPRHQRFGRSWPESTPDGLVVHDRFAGWRGSWSGPGRSKGSHICNCATKADHWTSIFLGTPRSSTTGLIDCIERRTRSWSWTEPNSLTRPRGLTRAEAVQIDGDGTRLPAPYCHSSNGTSRQRSIQAGDDRGTDRPG